jgi:hypothetical protein
MLPVPNAAHDMLTSYSLRSISKTLLFFGRAIAADYYQCDLEWRVLSSPDWGDSSGNAIRPNRLRTPMTRSFALSAVQA